MLFDTPGSGVGDEGVTTDTGVDTGVGLVLSTDGDGPAETPGNGVFVGWAPEEDVTLPCAVPDGA
ncbi:MAG TPA: hypothetical protein VF600_17510 [Abditibacteriaceae bacterium]